MRVSSLDHIHIYSAEPSRSIGFFSEVFGGEHLGALPGTENQGVLLGGQLLIIGPFPLGMSAKEPPAHEDGALASGYGVAHFGLQTDDLDDLVRRAKAAGADVHSEPRSSETVSYVYLTAPDGVVLEITQLNLSPKLRRLKPVFDGYNQLVHATRRLFLSQVFR